MTKRYYVKKLKFNSLELIVEEGWDSIMRRYKFSTDRTAKVSKLVVVTLQTLVTNAYDDIYIIIQ